MGLISCTVCGRKFSEQRKACPYCGVTAVGPREDAGSNRRKWRALVVLLVVLVVVNVYGRMTRETGPPPEVEAGHSSEMAVARCREGIETRLAERVGRVEGSLAAEYLQGGEYVVRGLVRVTEGRIRVTRSVVCEAQFRPESGWSIEHVEVGT